MTRYTIKYCSIVKKWWVYDTERSARVIALKLKHEAKAQAEEWNQSEYDTVMGESPKIALKYCGLEQYRYERGIHLNHPYGSEISESIHQAERDGFDTIWCHYSNVSCFEFAQKKRSLARAL